MNTQNTHKQQEQAGHTPRTDRLWLSEYPHDQERDERLERVLLFARQLEFELSAANAVCDAVFDMGYATVPHISEALAKQRAIIARATNRQH